MSPVTEPGIPVVGEAIRLHHSRMDRYSNGAEYLRECHCSPRVTAVEPHPSGLTHVWAQCTEPSFAVMLPLMVRLTPAGHIFNARMGGTPVKRHVRIVQSAPMAAAA